MADFEHIEARPWKEWPEKRLGMKPIKQIVRALRPAVFPTEPDTDARASWRRNERPQSNIMLPKDLALGERKNLMNRPGHGTGELLYERFPMIKEISTNTNTHIALSHEQPNHGGLCLELWGDAQDVQKATGLIGEWLEEEHRLKKLSKWPKVPHSSEAETARKVWTDFAIAQEFKKTPPDDVEFQNIGMFQWPTDFGPPDGCLGRSFEALDPIRIEECCYITFNPSGATFSVLGDSPKNVKRALIRLRAVYYQVCAWRSALSELYLVVPPGSEDQWSRVMLCNETLQSSLAHGSMLKKYPVGKVSLLPCIGGLGARDTKRLQETNIQNMREAIKYSLSRLPFYRGNLMMQVRLGKFLLTRYQTETDYSREEFMDMMADPQVHGEVTEAYGKRSDAIASNADGDVAEMLLGRLPGGLKAARDPSYVATFLVQKGSDWFRFDVEFQGKSEHEVLCLSQKWSRVETDTGHLYQILDASLLDISKDCAWHFEISAGHPIDERTAVTLNKFTDGVQLHYVNEQSQPQFSWKPTRGLVLKSYQQKVVWRYQPKDCDYVIEFSKIKDMPLTETALEAKPPKAEFTKSAVVVYAPHWARYLDQNAHMGVGERSTWNPNLETFFPPSKNLVKGDNESDGFTSFVHWLASVEDTIHNL